MTAVLIPLVPGGKRPIPYKWSDPDADWESWWSDLPEKGNVGRRCDGLVVVDCDSEAAGEAWREMCFGTPYVVKTPRGYHYYYSLPEGETVKGGPWRGHHGIDIKSGPGHYVVAPPSVRDDGVAYAWAGPVLNGSGAPVAPPEMLALFQESPRSADGGTDGFTEHFTLIPEGGRNNTLTAFAGLMRRLGFDDDGVARVLHGLNRSLSETPLPDDEVHAIVQSSARWDAEPEIELLPEDDDELILWANNMVLPPPAAWYWKPYVPQGRLVLLDGAEGIGKGLFCAQMAVAMTSGRWPEGGTERGRVLWLTAEDDPEEDVLRRLLASGYDQDEDEGVAFLTVDPSFPKHLPHLEQIVAENDIRLVIMDPGRTYLAPPEGVEMTYNNEAVLRPTLQLLNKLARRTETTILFVHHWNKDSTKKVQYRQGGSGAFAQVARHRVSLAWVGTTEEGQGAFEVTKSNIGPKGGLRAYSVAPNDEYDTAVLELGDELTEADMDAWLRARENAASASIEIDKGDLLATWCEGHLLPGDKVPGKGDLGARLGLPDAGVRVALGAAEDEGRIERAGNAYIWKG